MAPSLFERYRLQHHFRLLILVLALCLWRQSCKTFIFEFGFGGNNNYLVSSKPSRSYQSNITANNVGVFYPQTFNCKGLTIGSAYFELVGGNITLHMTTGYKAWESYTPFAAQTVRCSYRSRIGNYMTTLKHYSYCSIPYGGQLGMREMTVDLIDANQTSICNIKASILEKRTFPARHRLSALTTVQNSASHFQEWFNYCLCSGWSHFYVYDDDSNNDMHEILGPLAKSGFLTYTNWSHVLQHPSRQFMAMQDFLIRFKHETEYVAQLDDDCYFIARDQRQGLSTDFAESVQDYFGLSDHEGLCQIQVSSYWFGHGWVKKRDKPLALSSFLRANTSLSSKTFPWQSEDGEIRNLDTTLSIARANDIHVASGITHRWDMKRCKTETVQPPESIYFGHYKMKPWLESPITDIKGGWGSYQRNEGLWNRSATFLHEVEDKTMDQLDRKLNLSYTLALSDVEVLQKQCQDLRTKEGLP